MNGLDSRLRELSAQHPEWVFSSVHHMFDGLPAKHDFGVACLRRGRREYYDPPPDDKAVQRKLNAGLSALFEPVFLDVSHGYRPGRSRFTAVRLIETNTKPISSPIHVIRADIKDAFREIPHDLVEKCLDRRVTDGVVRRLIRKALNTRATTGLPECPVMRWQVGVLPGSPIGPIICNIVLHHVLDVWATNTFPDVVFVRYADDLLFVGGKDTNPAEILHLVERRLARYGMRLNDKKSEIVFPESGESLSYLGFPLADDSADIAA